MISRNRCPLSSQTKAKMQAFWKSFVYLIIDKYSMILKSFLAKLSRNSGIGKTKGSVKNHCRQSKQWLFICKAEDIIQDRPLTISEWYAVALRGQEQKRQQQYQNKLLETINLAIGMKVMVTQNVETDLDITNGATALLLTLFLIRTNHLYPTKTLSTWCTFHPTSYSNLIEHVSCNLKVFLHTSLPLHQQQNHLVSP